MTQTEYDPEDDDMDEQGRYRPAVMIGFMSIYILSVVLCCAGLLIWVNKDKVIPALLELLQWAINYY